MVNLPEPYQLRTSEVFLLMEITMEHLGRYPDESPKAAELRILVAKLNRLLRHLSGTHLDNLEG